MTATQPGGVGFGRYMTQDVYISASREAASTRINKASVNYYLTPHLELDTSASTNSTIKLNKAGWPCPFADLSLAFHDPRPLAYESVAISAAQFSTSVSSLQFGVTFKTTHPKRRTQSNRFLR